jgi:cation diffusion facilitator family transporter
MHKKSVETWQHHHVYNTEKKATETRTLIVIIITFVTMVAEITVGWLSNSMALLADGWHMGTHAFALGIALFAYVAARRYAHDARFNFGTWKIEILGAYSSAIVLGMVGILMIVTSIERLQKPLHIHYNEALIVAALGLAINVVCAMILGGAHHDHDHDRDDGHRHGAGKNADLNLKSAYLHVVADALTSVLAISALCGAKFLSADWLDPCMGIVGALLILRWSVLLLRDSGMVLLESETPGGLVAEIREKLESDGDTKVADLHVFRVADHKYACVATLLSHAAITIDEYKGRLKSIPGLVHVTLETNRCCDDTQNETVAKPDT